MPRVRHRQGEAGNAHTLETIRNITLDGVSYAPEIESASFTLELACADFAAEVTIRIQPIFSSGSDFDETHDVVISFPECLDIEQIPRIAVRSIDVLEILNATATDKRRKRPDIRGRLISALAGPSARLIIERQVNEVIFTVYIGEFSSQVFMNFSSKLSRIFQSIRHRQGARDIARRAS